MYITFRRNVIVMPNKIEKISKQINNSKGRSVDSIEYALYLTIGLKELCGLYFNYITETDIRNKLVKHILERVERQGQIMPREFLEKLLIQFSSSEGRERISLGTTIKSLSKYLSRNQRIKFVMEQLLSEKVSDRKRAYSLVDDSCVHQIEEKIWESWEQYSDNNCVALLAEKGSVNLLSEKFLIIWKSDDIKFYIKNNALKRVAVESFDEVIFLKDEAPISYLSACVAAKKPVDDAFGKSGDSIPILLSESV